MGAYRVAHPQRIPGEQIRPRFLAPRDSLPPHFYGA
jgi:hypothetical protein